MPKVVYGFRKGGRLDFRNVNEQDRPETPFLFDDYVNGKPVKLVISWHGFLVYDEGIDIASAMCTFMRYVSEHGCCGRCIPGKNGTTFGGRYRFFGTSAGRFVAVRLYGDGQRKPCRSPRSNGQTGAELSGRRRGGHDAYLPRGVRLLQGHAQNKLRFPQNRVSRGGAAVRGQGGGANACRTAFRRRLRPVGKGRRKFVFELSHLSAGGSVAAALGRVCRKGYSQFCPTDSRLRFKRQGYGTCRLRLLQRRRRTAA